MKRKILSLILVFAMTVSLFTVGASAAEPIYRDTNGHWAAETIEGFSRLGLIEGYNGQFFPNKNITRGEMAVILDRLMDYQTAAKNSFSDLGEAFYTDAVLKANAAGVMLGSNGTVRPTDPITRQEAAVLLCRALGLEGGGSVAQFSDRWQIASWAADAVGVMAAKKLLQGANGLFRPTEAITRAETVTILDRALGKLVSAGESASGRVDGDVVIRGAGAKLSDMTINGDLIIAEGVGEGEVHLDGVTITGRTIVRGGGVNSIYMNNVRANGGVVVNKLDGKVRVVTSGNTTVSVTLLQSGAILVGDGFKTVEIPADIAKGQTVEIQGNIERLVNSSENVEITANGTIQTVEANAKTEIKGDAKVVGATGSADVKVNGSAVAKTDKPAAGGNGGSGGSSGGNSSTASKEITGVNEVTLDVPFGTKSATEALEELAKKDITLNLKGGSTTTTKSTDWKWADGVTYDGTTAGDYKATTTVTDLKGYTYNGTLTAEAKVTVLPLDKTGLEAALKAANDVLKNAIDDEKTAATDKTKILITDKTADAVTDGVRFTTDVAKNTLETAISTAKDAEKAGFASQSKCKEAADTLQAAITAFNNTIQTGTNKNTDAYILQKVKDVVSEDGNPDAPYSSEHPLKLDYVYKFVGDYNLDNASLHFEWKAQWKNQNETSNIEEYITIGDVRGTGGQYNPGAKVIKAPDEPKEVQFVVTVTDFYGKEVGKLGENGEYSATLGAPISVDKTQPDTVPQFTVISDGTSSSTGATKFTGVVPITLKGAEAIKSVSNDCVTMADSNTNVTGNEVSLKSIHVDKVEQSKTGLNVTVSVTTGSIGGVWNENPPYPFKEGKLPNISIDTSKLQLKENTLGWYLPTDALKLNDTTVEVLTPVFTGVERTDDQATGNPTFTIQTQNMPENATVEVALEKTTVTKTTDIDNATIKKDAKRGDAGKYSVTFDKNDFEAGAEYYLWFRYGAPGSDWVYENVSPRPTYTPNPTTGGDPGSSVPGGGGTGGGSTGGSDSGNTTEGSQAGA